MDNSPIAMLLPSLRGDGAVRMMLTLAGGFVEHGYKVDLLVARCEGEMLAEIPENVRLVDMKATRSTTAVPAIVRYLRKSRPRVLFATEHYTGLPAMYALMLARTKTRCVIRQDNTWSMDKKRFRGYNRWLVPFAVQRLFPNATIVAVSKGVAEDLASRVRIPDENLKVIYNPVITPRLRMLAQRSPDHPWLLQDGPPVILAIGRLTPAKGFDVLIEAFAGLRRHKAARLLILGEGPERARLESRIAELGLQDHCQLSGFKSNPYSFMANADIFVLPSRWEGLPTVLIEALSLGVPVIATDCPSGPHEILDGGRFGKLVPVENPEALCSTLLHTLENPTTPDISLRDWLQQFTLEQSVSAHLKLIED